MGFVFEDRDLWAFGWEINVKPTKFAPVLVYEGEFEWTRMLFQQR